MRVSQALFILVVYSVLVLGVNAQQYSYPNEVKGFELFKKGNWKSLIPLVSTKSDVEGILGKDCKDGCDYDRDWRMQVMYIGEVWGFSQSQGKSMQCVAKEMLGKYSNIIFYPKKRVTRSQLKFERKFSRSTIGISHSNPSIMDVYGDSWGLSYDVAAEDTHDKAFRKGDLVQISYGYSVADYEKYRSKIGCS